MNCPAPDYSAYACYALACNPQLSAELAAKHFAALDERETFESIALATAASSGKTIARRPMSENHWLETAWGRQYWELKQTYNSVAYGSRFAPIAGGRSDGQSVGNGPLCGS